MRPTAHPMRTHLSQDNRPRRSSIPVATMSTSSGTKARSRRQPSPSNSFRTIQTKRIAGLTLQPRRTAPTFCKEGGRSTPLELIPGRASDARPRIADTILDRNDHDQSFASGTVETWLRWLVTLPDEHACFALGFFAPGYTELRAVCRYSETILDVPQDRPGLSPARLSRAGRPAGITTHPGDSQTVTWRIRAGHRSQSETDWAHAKRSLALSDSAEQIMQRIADYRADDFP